MKLLFAHDTKIKEDTNGTYYTSGSYSEKVWNRYLSISNEFSIIARKDQFIYEIEDAKEGFNFFDKEKIKFIEIPNLNSSIKDFFDIKKRNNLNDKVKNAVLENDFLIARLPSNIGNIAVKYAIKYKRPYLVEVVGCSFDSLWYYNIKGKILAPLYYLKQKKVVRDAPYVIYVTNSFLQNRYRTKGSSVNCSNVSLTNIDENVLKKRIDKISNMHMGSKLVIGTAATVDVRYKGQESVIKALGMLKKQGITNFEYQLIGGGDQSYLISVAEENDVSKQVKLLGAMPHKEVFNWLDSIDIYVQPSKTEGLPRALIEAMSRGLFAIGSNAGGIPELLDEKYIFSKSKNNEVEIYNLLKEVKIDDLLLQARRNYKKSKEYDRRLIEMRRQSFFRKFLSQN